MLPRLGLAAGAAGWKAGHEAIRSGALVLTDLDDAGHSERLTAYAAERAREYMRQIVAAHELPQAEGVRLFAVYLHTFMRGALDQALDAGALLGGN